MSSRPGPSSSSSRLGAATPESSARLDPSSASASTSQPQAHNRRTSLDTRSLRAPSIRHPHLTASPSTPGVATSALSASPEELTIGRGLPSGSGGGRGGNNGSGGEQGGGAAATLKRVASNASIAQSIRGVFTSSPAPPADGKQQQQQQQHASASMTVGEQGQGAVASSSPQATDGQEAASKGAGTLNGKAKDAATKAPPSTRAAVPPPVSSADAQPSSSSSSSSTPQASQFPPPPASQQQQSSSASATNSTSNAAAGSKRQSPPSNHLRAEAASRGTAKRRTWYGWTVDDDAAASQQAGSSSASTADGEAGQDVEMAEAEPTAATAPKAPEPEPTPPPASAPVASTSAEPSQIQTIAQAQDTLKVPATARGPRTSWFGWGTSTQPPPPPDTGPATVDAEMNDGQGAESAEREDEVTIKAKGQPGPETQSPSPEAASKQGEPSSATVSDAPPPPSWVWRLFGSQQGQAADAAATLPPPPSESAAEPELAKADEEMQVDSTPAAGDSTWSRWIPIPYWGSTPAQQQEQSAASSSSSPPQASPLTPAEQVKADALARPALQSPPIEPKDAILNAATRQSWISYFSNRNAAKPAAKVASGEPEIMEVDFGDQDAGAARTKTATTTLPAAKPAAVASLAGPSSAKSSRPSTPRPDNVPKPDPAPPVDRPTTPLTGSKTKAVEAVKKGNQKKPASLRPPIPNLVLPTFEDTFYSTPRSLQPPAGMLKRTLSAVNTWLSGTSPEAARLRTAPKLGKDGRSISGQASSTSDELGLALAEEAAVRLPRAWSTMGNRSKADKRGCQGMGRIVVVGIHGWFAQSWASRFMGEPTGTSVKFATEMRDAVLRHFGSVPGLELNMEAVTMIPLSADGTVAVRVDRSFAALLSKREWVEALDTADAVLFACHSQGCIVGTNLLARCIEQGVIHPRRSRISLLSMCGIHAGPFEHLRSTVVGSYLNYFENAAARELFEFQKRESQQYRQYEHSLSLVLAHGVKVTLVASTDDQVVPLHSALFASAHHPSILRALYIHGPTFPRLDFLTNMLTFCVAVRNAGLADHDLLQLLSASVAGSLYGGLGHSLCYEEKGVYDLAVRYLFETTHPLCEPTTRGAEDGPPKLRVVGGSGPGTAVEGTSNGFASSASNNPHLLPWSLRGILEDRAVRATFGAAIDDLVESYEKWTPSTRTLRDVQYRLEPMRFVPRSGARSVGDQKEGKKQEQEGKGAKASKKGKVEDERSGTEGSGEEAESGSHDSTIGGRATGKQQKKGLKEAAAPAKGKAVTTGKAAATASTSSSKL